MSLITRQGSKVNDSDIHIPRELLQNIREGRCVPFLGAGISRPSGVADWDTLVRTVGLNLESLFGRTIRSEELDLLQVPFMYKKTLASSDSLRRIISDATGKGYAPNEYHILLSHMPFRTYLTTNWDELLETQLANVYGPRGYNIVANQSEVASWNEANAIQIVKLHGTVTQPESVVFGEDDYHQFYGSPSLLIDLTKVLFATRSILFLGFSMRDAYVKFLFQQVRNLLAASTPPHFIVIPDDGSIGPQSEYLRAMGFQVIRVPSIDGNYPLLPFLETLHSTTAVIARDRLERTRLILRETERLMSYLGPDKVIRIRAVLGPLGNPNVTSEPIFGSHDQDLLECQLRNLCESLVTEGFTLRLIGLPTDVEFVLTKGYSKEQMRRRLACFVDTAQRLEDRFEYAPAVRANDRNTWIVADLGVIESWKSSGQEGRLFTDAVLTTERAAVARSAKWFDEDFNELVAANGGISACRTRVIKSVEELLD